MSLFLQMVLAVGGYFATFMPGQAILVGRLLAAAVGGCFYGMDYGSGATPCALGGALAGGGGVVPAVILSVMLGDAPGSMIPLATGACILAGGVGGAIGLWVANMRRKGY